MLLNKSEEIEYLF